MLRLAPGNANRDRPWPADFPLNFLILVGPETRANAVGIYRLWRDLGYAAGGLLAGALTDLLGFRPTILIIALLLIVSSAIAHALLPAPAPSRRLGERSPRGSSGVASGQAPQHDS